MVRLNIWVSEVPSSNFIFSEIFEVVSLFPIFYVFTKHMFSPSCNKVARRPVDAPGHSFKRRHQRAQFHKGASWDRSPHNVYNELERDVLTHSTIKPITKGAYFIECCFFVVMCSQEYDLKLQKPPRDSA